MSILDGEQVDSGQIDPLNHNFIGMWRPPKPPTLSEVENMPHNKGRAGTDCTCGGGLVTSTMDYLGVLRRHWAGGCFDEGCYLTKSQRLPTIPDVPEGYLTDDEYRDVYSKVPRLCVGLVIRVGGAVLLVPRLQKPCVGMLHLPGGRVRLKESINDAAVRIAAAELDAIIEIQGTLGYIEFGDLVTCHSVSLALACKLTSPVSHVLIDGTTWVSDISEDVSTTSRPEYNIMPWHADFLRTLAIKETRG